MPSGIELAREELIRLITILDNIARLRLEPFSVNIKTLLERLRRILHEHGETEIIVLDADTLYRVSVVLGVQQRWIRERASALFIDSQLIYSRVVSSEPAELVGALLSSWRPLVRIEQVSIPLLLRGYDHFTSLPTRDVRREDGHGELQAEHATYALEEEAMSEKLREIREELQARSQGWTDYWEFIGRGSAEERYERAYALSFLITNGEVELRINPLNEEIKIRPSHKREEGEGNRVSFVTTVRMDPHE